MKVLIVHLESKGLQHDADVLFSYIGHICKEFLKKDIEIFRLTVPGYLINKSDYSFPTPDSFDFHPDLVIHLESIYSIKNAPFGQCLHIFIPNPEWTNSISTSRLGSMDKVWHKTRYSHRFFSENFSDVVEHVHLGFTSLDLGFRVKNFVSVAHFKGKAVARNSEEILSIWSRRKDFPSLRLRFYSLGAEIMFFKFPAWFRHENVEIKVGIYSDEDYFADLSESGIHLCTSEMEGFGHHINECRMMGGVPIVIDGEPMNELVDGNSGFLIKPASSKTEVFAKRFKITEEALEKTLDKVFAFSPEELALKGKNARLNYERDRSAFVSNLRRELITLLK